jgi:hypothetical protein
MPAKRQDLYLQVSGSVAPLTAAVKTGKSALNDLGTAAVDVLTEVEKAFDGLGKGGAPGLKEVERAYDATFRRIRENAKAAIAAPTGQAAVQIIDANASREAALAAEAKATAYRQVAEAASRADQAQGGQNAAVRAYAVAAATATVEAEREALALREQATTLGLVEGKLDATAVAQRRAATVTGQTRSGYQQLSFQLGDVATQYAAGTAATVIFAQQSGQVIQALTLISGEAKGVLGVLAGPWGVAISAALVALTPFVGKLLEGNDALQKAIDKLKEDAEQTQVAADAKERFAQTLTGVEQALRDNEKALKDQADGYRSVAEKAELAAEAQLKLLRSARASRAAALADAQAQYDRDQALAKSNRGGDVNLQFRLDQAPGNIAAVQALLARIDAAIAKAEGQARTARLDQVVEVSKLSEIDKLNRRYDDQVRDARKRAELEKTTEGALKRQLDHIKAMRDAEIARERAAEQRRRGEARGNLTPSSVGKVLTNAFGGHITSTTGGKHVANSYHYRGQAVDFVPEGGVGAISKAELRAALEAAGVPIKELLGPGDKDHNDHFHVAFGKTGRSQEAIDQRAAADARRVQAAEDKRIQDADAYAQLLGGVQEKQLELRRRQVLSIEAAADLDVRAVEAEREQADRAAQKGVELRRWTQAEADAVKAVAAQNAELQTQAIRQHERSEVLQRQLAAERADIDRQVETLRLQADLAGTAKQRRAIALQLLALEEERLRKERQAIIDDPTSTPEQKAQAENDLQAIADQHDLRRQQVEQQNAGAIEQYLKRLKDEAGDVDEALEGVAAHGLQSLEDGLVDLISGSKSLGEVFGDIAASMLADIVRLIAKMLILRALQGAIGGVSDGGGDGAGLIGSIGGFLFPGGGFGGGIPGRAAGGPVKAGRPYVVGERRAELFVPEVDGRIVPRLPDGAELGRGGGMAASVTVTIDARGADPAGLARVQASVDQLRAELPGRVLATMSDARQRLVWR